MYIRQCIAVVVSKRMAHTCMCGYVATNEHNFTTGACYHEAMYLAVPQEAPIFEIFSWIATTCALLEHIHFSLCIIKL